MTSEQKFKDAKRRGTFCAEGLAWAKRKTLLRAWETCVHGGWMAWWLNDYYRVSNYDLLCLRQSLGLPTRMYGCDGWTDNQRLRWADALRKNYTAAGRRRVVK